MANASKKEPSKRRGKVVKNGDAPASFEAGGGVAPSFFDAETVGTGINAWWHSERDAFYRASPDGRWAKWNQQALIDVMRKKFCVKLTYRDGEMLAESREALLWIRENRAIDGVMAALGGYAAGVHDLPDGERVLVKKAPLYIEPVEGEWPTIRAIIDVIFGPQTGDEVDQREVFYSLCRTWHRAFKMGSPSKSWKKGHGLIMVGEHGCGKNLVQELILTPLVGGRAADPLKFLTGQDEFNGDLVRAEHWLGSELPASAKTEDKVAFGEAIKKAVAEVVVRARLMREEPSTIVPFKRLSLSLNPDVGTMMKLPGLVKGFGDKIVLLRCHKGKLPVLGDDDLGKVDHGEDGEEVEASWENDDDDDSFSREQRIRGLIASEMPAFCHWLLYTWRIPAWLLEDDDGQSVKRFGFKAWHHPIIRDQLFDETTHAQLLRIIDQCEFRVNHSDEKGLKLWELTAPHNHRAEAPWRRWWGSAEQLSMLLTGQTDLVCSHKQMAIDLLKHSRIGTLLKSLADDERVGGAMGRVYHGESTRTSDWRGYWLGAPSD